MLIFKKSLLQHTGVMKINLPYATLSEAKNSILKLDMQYDIPCMWFIHNNNNKQNEYLILAIGTGHDYENLNSDCYLGTLLLYNDSLVLHYFLLE